MRMKPIHLDKKNRLVDYYRKQKEEITSFFDYKPYDNYEDRIADLQKRTFDRSRLVTILHNINSKWDAPLETLKQIDRLKDRHSVVVIGGQQAGLLTGPLYTVNKIISIIKFAKQQEKSLNIPVVPVFWIAGEDHDYDEINHIYTIRNKELYKHTTKQQLYLKKSISHLELDKRITNQWLQQVFNDLMETEYTKDVLETIQMCLKKSHSYVDFFARLIFQLFPDDGIVLVDSANPLLRKLESKWFTQFIHKQSEITKAVYHSIQNIKQKGFSLDLDIEENDTNLFFHDENNERILLKRVKDKWKGKNDEVELTTEQMLEVARQQPERLSNNVITRPIMQELIFPTLAFIGGDGEISYWSVLKQAFREMDNRLTIPPLIPRLSFTFVTNRINKLLKTRIVEPEYVINNGIEDLKINWLHAQQHPPINQVFHGAKRSIEKVHLPLQQLAQSIRSDLGETAKKNMHYISNQLTYLESKVLHTLHDQYQHELSQFDEISVALQPNQQLQERVWNPITLINEYGFSIFRDIIEYPCSFMNEHYLIYFDEK